jgi:predicted esterase
VWYGFHGYGQLARSLARDLLPLAAEHHLVAPEGLSRFYARGGDGRVGASWMTRDDREVEITDYVRYLDLVHQHVRAPAGIPVRLLGFSQGAATACRWAAQGAARPDRVVLWGGDVPPDLDWPQVGDRLRGIPFTLVTGSADPYMPREAVERSADRLREHGVSVELRWFEGGHHLDSGILGTLAA